MYYNISSLLLYFSYAIVAYVLDLVGVNPIEEVGGQGKENIHKRVPTTEKALHPEFVSNVVVPPARGSDRRLINHIGRVSFPWRG